MWRYALVLVAGCSFTSHPVRPSPLGSARAPEAMEPLIDSAGPITVETVNTADWVVPLSGLVNLKNPATSGLVDHDEPIQVFVHVLRHPRFGTFLVDTGIEHALASDPSHSAFGWLVRMGAHTDKMVVHEDTAHLVARVGPIAGVLLTHVHLDHIAGLPDVPAGVPIYAGRGDTEGKAVMNVLMRGTVDALFAGHEALSEWPYARGNEVIDVLGDGSLWAIHTPGHTPGNTAYLVRTPSGPVLLTGDTCHSRWGWEHHVEPGDFSADVPESAKSFQALQALAARHPQIDVRLGHQYLNARAGLAGQ